MKKYLRVMRIDHWIKQFFIVPGCICAYLLAGEDATIGAALLHFVVGFLGTSLIASANYVINEWLDAAFDRFHPTKKNRSVVTEDVDGRVIWALWGALSLAGFCLGWLLSLSFLVTQIWLWVMGILYNVKPFRTKDIAILDVLSESVNNAIRLLMGWFLISPRTLPPCSILLGYWMAGAFLMAIKRYAEYRMIGDPELAGKYRRSFRFYTEKSLLISAFFYAMCSVLFIGIFLTKYRIELILFMPLLIGLFCYYFWISFKQDSAVQKPEKLYGEKGLMAYLLLLAVVFTLLMLIDIPALNIFVTNALTTF